MSSRPSDINPYDDITDAEYAVRKAYVDKAFEFLEVSAEGSENHRKIIEAYNAAPGGGGMTTTLAWCATFVGAMGYLAGLAGTAVKINPTCISQDNSLRNQYRAVGTFKLVGDYTYPDRPKIGDIAFWSTPPWVEDNISHVGIVIRAEWVDDYLQIETIDGNWADNVRTHGENSDYHVVACAGLDFTGFNFPDRKLTKVYYNSEWWEAAPMMFHQGEWWNVNPFVRTDSEWQEVLGGNLNQGAAFDIVDESQTITSSTLSDAEMQINATYLWQQFQSKGWTANAVAGLFGNIQAESRFSPSVNEYGGGGGYGLVQWTPGTDYINWCNSQNLDPTLLSSAVTRILTELNNGWQYYTTSEYPLSFEDFTKSSATPEYLARAFCKNYERPRSDCYTEPKEYEGGGVLHTSYEWRQIWARRWYVFITQGIYQQTTS